VTDLQVRPGADVLESVVAQGDLAKLSNEQRVLYYLKVCDSLGLNPATRPFEFIVLNGRMVLYARKEASDQLRQSRGVSVTITGREKVDDIYIVTAKATLDGRTDESIGAVNIGGLKGDALANALMKAETKAKRRVTLSICGLGWSDETEVETIPGAKTVTVDATTGEIKPEAPQIEAHWSADAQVRKAFWAETSRLGLTNEEVHKALGTEHLSEYAGTREGALKVITEYIKRNSAA
jgi:hypothetical protein